MTRTLGADLLAVVARLNRLASQRARIPLPFAQGRLLSARVIRGGERATLSQAALETVRLAQPFPPPPAVLGPQIIVNFPIAYTAEG